MSDYVIYDVGQWLDARKAVLRKSPRATARAILHKLDWYFHPDFMKDVKDMPIAELPSARRLYTILRKNCRQD